MFLQASEFLHQSLGHLLRALLAVEVVELVRVFVEVVEFPGIDVAIEVDEFPAVGGAHAAVALDGMLGGIFVEVVVEAFAPVLGMFAAKEWQEAFALDVARYLCAGNVEEGGRVVDVLHHFGDVAAGLQSFGQAHHEGRGEGLLIHEALVKPSVLAHVEALVGGIDHEGILEQTSLFEVVERAADIVVQALEHLGIVAHIALELELGQLLALQVAAAEVDGQRVVELVVLGAVGRAEAANHVEIVGRQAGLNVGVIHLRVVRQVHIVVAGNAHLLRLGGLATCVVVVERFGNGEGLVLVFVEVFQFGQPAAVAGFLVNEEDE